MVYEYRHAMIRETYQLLNSLIKDNFSRSTGIVLWMKIRPAAEKMFRELDNSGEENLRNLALKYRELVSAAERDGLYGKEIESNEGMAQSITK